MSKNKRAPNELQKYAVVIGNKANYTANYFSTQKEAREFAKNKVGRKKLFKISYDFYEVL
jgi:hypothetical protein